MTTYYNRRRHEIRQRMSDKRSGRITKFSHVKMNSRIKKIEKTLSSMEKKFIDTDLDTAAVASTGLVVQGFVIPQGDGQSARKGRRIQLTSVEWKGTITLAGSATLAEGTDTIRLMCLVDKQTNGALPAVTDVLVLAEQESYKELETSRGFRTIWDKNIVINCKDVGGDGTTIDTAPASKWFHYYTKLNIPINYDSSASTGAIATITTNNVIFLVINRLRFGGIQSRIRFRYTDL